MSKRKLLALILIGSSTLFVIILIFENFVLSENSNLLFFDKEKVARQGLVKSESICKKKLEIQGLYPVDKYEGVPAPVDYSKFPEAKLYHTAITESASLGPNFAGHFTVATWGCGTDCFQYAVIDAITGEIIAYSSANNGYHLRKNHDWENHYLILDPVYAGKERKYYRIVEGKDNNNSLELICIEISEIDMYSPQELN